MDPASLLDDCIERLRSGQSEVDCLERYPAEAAELKPALVAASRLRMLLAGAQLSEEQRARGKALLRQALVAQNANGLERPSLVHWWTGGGWWGRTRVAALAGVVAVVACSTWMVGTVAASGPGDQAYGLRVWAERVPTWFQADPLGRASAELSLSERRLAELRAQPDRIDPRGLDALLMSDQAAARAAAGLPDQQRNKISARVAEHGRILQTLAAQAPQPAAADALLRAAGRVEVLGQAADGSSGTPGESEPPASPTPSGPAVVPAHTPTLTPGATAPAPPARQTTGEANSHSARDFAPGHAKPDATVEPPAADGPGKDGAGSSTQPLGPPGLTKKGITAEPWTIPPIKGDLPAGQSTPQPAVSTPDRSAPGQPHEQRKATPPTSKAQGHASQAPADQGSAPGRSPDKQNTPGAKHEAADQKVGR